MKPNRLKSTYANRLASVAATLAFSAAFILVPETAKSQQITMGNCTIPAANADPQILATFLLAFWNNNNIPPDLCAYIAKQVAATVGTTATAPTTTAPTTSAPVASSTPTTDPNADSDGDGLLDSSDPRPLIADIPVLSYGFIGQTSIGATLTERGTNKENKIAKTLSRETGTSTEQSNSSTYSNEISVEVSGTVSFNPVVGASSVTATAGYSHSWENSYTKTSVQDSREAYEDLEEKTESINVTFQGGSIGTTVQITNEGNAAVSIGDFSVEARKRTGRGANHFESVAVLKPEVTGNEFKRDLAPGNSIKIPVGAKIDDLATVEDLLANPEALYFVVIDPQLTWPATGQEARFQKSFALTQTEIQRKTVGVTVDYGRGKVEVYHVAVGTGKSLAQLMQAINLKYEAQEQRLIGLCKSLGSDCPTNEWQKADDGAAWRGSVVAPKTRNPRLTLSPGGKLEDTQLVPGDAVFMVFVEDRDKDGLARSEEVRYRTIDDPKECVASEGCKDPKDFDGDSISDFDEIRKGWQVGFAPKGKKADLVYSSPTSGDADEDGWDDKKEQTAKTDPNLNDTDMDTLADAKDSDPLVPDVKVAAAAVAAAAPAKLTVETLKDFPDLEAYLEQKQIQRYGSALLLGKPTSSSVFGGGATHAANQAVNGFVEDLAHTNNGANEWWRMSFGKAQEVRQVVIWNRTGDARIKDFDLVLYKDGKEVALDKNKDGDITRIPLWEGGDYLITERRITVIALPPGKMADTVEIKAKPGKNQYLNFSEIEVYGSPPSTPTLKGKYKIQVKNQGKGQSGWLAAWSLHGGLRNGGHPIQLYTGEFNQCGGGTLDCTFIIEPAPNAPRPDMYTIRVENPKGEKGFVAAWGAATGIVNNQNKLNVYAGSYDTCAKGDCDFIIVPVPGKPDTYRIRVRRLANNQQWAPVVAWDAWSAIGNGGNQLSLFTEGLTLDEPNTNPAMDFIITPVP